MTREEKRLANAQRMYDALQRIAKLFYTSEEIQRRGEALYGLPWQEVLEMTYDNMQQTARDALKGIRRPK